MKKFCALELEIPEILDAGASEGIKAKPDRPPKRQHFPMILGIFGRIFRNSRKFVARISSCSVESPEISGRPVVSGSRFEQVPVISGLKNIRQFPIARSKKLSV